MTIQGNGFSQLVQLMRKHGYNKDVDIILGTVIAPPPEIKVRLDDSPIELDRNDLIATQTVVSYPLVEGDRLIVAAMDEKMQYVILDKAVRF